MVEVGGVETVEQPTQKITLIILTWGQIDVSTFDIISEYAGAVSQLLIGVWDGAEKGEPHVHPKTHCL